jgi:DNA invertase Pin-like site-specific DNA recombinase
LVILDEARWAELRGFRGLHASGALSVSEIARETGLHRRTVRKFGDEVLATAILDRLLHHCDVISMGGTQNFS